MSLIRVRLETKARLERLRNFPLKTMDDVISMLLDQYEEKMSKNVRVPENIPTILWDELMIKEKVDVKDFAEKMGVNIEDILEIAKRFSDRGVVIENGVAIFDRVKFEDELRRVKNNF